MQIIIPMSGFGERFRRVGYKVPKPLIEIDGKPIVAHVIDMFPGEEDFIFICNQDHLDNADYRMEEILKEYCPTGRVVGIPPHKLGPIHAVRQVEQFVDLGRPVVINYCDFTCYWDWNNFKKFVAEASCVGAIPAYKGFHPHTLGSTNYAYMREANGWVQDIQEKQPYTDNRMEEFASSGTYYFSSGQVMSDALRQTMEQDLNVGGEYYVSLAYKPLLAANQPIAVYPLQHFMQWGTPDDVAEYRGWSGAFKQLLDAEAAYAPQGALVVPMAGLGQRFANEGYTLTKPLIPVSGKPMVAQATHDLPPSIQQVFVLRSDMPEHESITQKLQALYPSAILETLPGVTDGQACTAMIGVAALGSRPGSADSGPITVGACDNGALYNLSTFQALANADDVDIIVWVARGHANAVRNPKMFGWVEEIDGVVKNISVKTPLDSPATDPIVIGTFTFRRREDFERVVKHLIARDGRINGEFYLDSCINDAIKLGLRCRIFEVDHFLSWGTPNDLRTFEYWQSCFHKWADHPYRLELDARVEPLELSNLERRYQALVPSLPGDKA